MTKRRHDGGFQFDELAEVALTAIRLEGTVDLLFGEDRRFKFQIERDFVIRNAESCSVTKVEFLPYGQGDRMPQGMDELAALFRATVVTACAEADATLRITFADGRVLEVQPDPQYEAWNFWHPNGVLGQPAGGGFIERDSD